MSKKYKGKTCVYCRNSPSMTEDHVFAREFFLLQERHNLPKAPACRHCNEEKARLEHYLVTVLPFGGRHEQSVSNLRTNVPRRLAKNWKLHSELMRTMKPAWVKEGDGLFQRTSVVAFDGGQLERLLVYVGRGLAWHHWKTYLGPEDGTHVMFVPDVMSAAFKEMVRRWNVAHRVVNDLGHGTVLYEGVQAVEPAGLMVWTVSIYGVVLTGDGGIPGANTTGQWWVFTGPPEIGELVERLKS